MHHLTFPSAVYESSVPPYPHQLATVISLFNCRHTHGCLLVAQYGFSSYFLMIDNTEHISMCLLDICVGTYPRKIKTQVYEKIYI